MLSFIFSAKHVLRGSATSPITVAMIALAIVSSREATKPKYPTLNSALGTTTPISVPATPQSAAGRGAPPRRGTQGSHRRRRANRDVACKHLKISRQRRDFHFKTANHYAQAYGRICVEDLNVCGMVRNHHLAKSIHDASWRAFLDILSDKAERAGHQVIRVPARFTTQKRRRCGEYVQKSLSVRTHICPSCGLIEDRDVNAARNIVQAGAPPSGTGAAGFPIELRSPAL
jgi:IS605 OrfB family transposase